jgi:hypothetical protein
MVPHGPSRIARRKGTWQSRLEVLAAARQKVEREQRRLAQVAERKHREMMAQRDDEEEEALRSSAKLAKGGPKRMRTTPQRKPKSTLGLKRQNRSPHLDDGFLGLKLRCPHCDVEPIMDAAVDGAGNVACYDCLREYAAHLAPVTRLRRCQDSSSGADSPFDDDGASQEPAAAGWMRQSDKQAAASRGVVATGWGDLSDSGGEHDQSPSTSAIDKLLEAAGAGGGGGGEESTQAAANGAMEQGGDDHVDVRPDVKDDFAAAALLFPGVGVQQQQQQQEHLPPHNGAV